MILSLESLDRRHNRVDLIDHERPQTVLLIQVRVQELFHSFSILIVLVDASPVVLFLLCENVDDNFLELLKGVADLSVEFALSFAVVNQRLVDAVAAAARHRHVDILLSDLWRNRFRPEEAGVVGDQGRLLVEGQLVRAEVAWLSLASYYTVAKIVIFLAVIAKLVMFDVNWLNLLEFSSD